MFDFGQKLYLKRLEKGMTQLELARKTGIPQSNLSNIERGKRDITLSTFLKICSALEVRPAKLLETIFPPSKSSLTRPSLSRIVKAVVGKPARLNFREKRIANLLSKICPPFHKYPLKKKDIHLAWYKLRTSLTGSEINNLTKRVRDESERRSFSKG